MGSSEPGQVVIAHEDITDRKRTEEDLWAVEERLHAIPGLRQSGDRPLM